MSDPKESIVGLGRSAGLELVEGDGMPIVTIDPDLNKTAALLGQIVSRLDLFEMNGDQVFFDHRGEMKVMTGRKFCTWINNHVLLASKFDGKSGEAIPGMLGIDAAGVILDAENFRRGVRKLKGVNHVRCPLLRPAGVVGRETAAAASGKAGKAQKAEEAAERPQPRLELLPWGYDGQTQIYTVPGGLEFDLDLDLAAAKGRLRRQFETFPLTDDRSMAVQVAAMLALFIRHLPGGMGLRPGILFYANKAGSGKSVLAKACLYPVLGSAAAAKMKKNEDLDKELEAFCRASAPYIFLDNIYGGIQSASIDQLLTSEESTGRAMGGHGVFLAKNTALLLATGNQLELNEDALRRFLVVDLFEKGNPDERVVPEALNDTRMRSPEWRISMLEALWALVRHWHEQGMPRGTVALPSFEEYAALLGGIVEAAGYLPPFTKAVLPDAKLPGGADFEELMALVLVEMEDAVEKKFTVEDFARLARSAQLYQKQVGTLEEGKKLTIKEDGLGKEERALAEDRGYMTPAHRSSFGKVIAKQAGTEHKVKGYVMELGKREQARKAAFTVTILSGPEKVGN